MAEVLHTIRSKGVIMNLFKSSVGVDGLDAGERVKAVFMCVI